MENAVQTQKQREEQLGVFQASISDRLKAMGNIQKEGKTISQTLLARYERKSFLHRNVIYYDLLKPIETVNTDRYRQKLID